MVKDNSIGAVIAKIIIVFVLVFLSILCIIPIINILAISFSSSSAVSAGRVYLWPVDFTLNSYEFAMHDGRFLHSFLNSIVRVILGVGINMILVVITAYPLSKTNKKVHGRDIYMAYFVLTMLIGGGLIPTYLVVAKTGLLNTIWSLVIPGALPVYYMVIMMNFMRALPKEIEEAAFIDGASPLQTLIRVIFPLLKPSLATIALFSMVGHWNDWFSPMIYMNSSADYPLQTYLKTQIVNIDELLRQSGTEYAELIAKMNARTGRASQVFLAAVPLLAVYPFLQKYFTKGLTLGSVKE